MMHDASARSPTVVQRMIVTGYGLAWFFLLPIVVAYLWLRGRRDPDYRRHLGERFAFYRRELPRGVIWIHAVSLGETRSAQGLIRAMIDRGDRILLTHVTPAGRRESARLFGKEIASGEVTVVWFPFDMLWCHRRLIKACSPRIALTLEVEIWPAMIHAARSAGVPLYLCNGQYASRPLARDSRGLRLRQRVMHGLAGAFVKSELQAERFASIGLTNVTVTGELRFDQPVPDEQIAAAQSLRAEIDDSREVITIASGVEKEEDLFVDVITAMKATALSRGQSLPLFVYVPRAPERFDFIPRKLAAAGLSVERRSKALDANLLPLVPLGDVDVLVGDSLGEMFFYLALAEKVVVGGGFTERGAHNVIEPLMLGKPVLTGPHVWTIEYPFAEAEAAGLARSVPDRDGLISALGEPPTDLTVEIEAFLAEHGGASFRTLAAIDRVLEADPTDQCDESNGA